MPLEGAISKLIAMLPLVRALIMVFILTSTCGLVGCISNKPIDTSTVEGSFQQAKRLHKQGRHEEALVTLSGLRAKHPYSRWATEAELLIADIYFYQRLWVEAESRYKLFKELHPKHEKIDYVTFHLAMSLFNQLPLSVDRDINLAEPAFLSFGEVVKSFPKSEYYQKSKDYQVRLRKMMVQREMYIADFYLRQKHFLSAKGRYIHVLDKYPNLGYNLQALYGVVISAHRIKDFDESKLYLSRLAREFPNSVELSKVKEVVKHGK